ncbi:hypothetical protein Q5H91_02725 [Sphingomonas sp. KR1UV-12]|uniref:DUF2336 domain-containing protein n=1 Tax=Sphingomonas aurea TaxID=3063994 RepID=A0ABT9EH58_9SPHN|nr:hypothetical protein [Sphingomonas sp. KR1UV-12]MDP1026113.1 hypothetical protein [Sphingomonas sp. KR1UV-12]
MAAHSDREEAGDWTPHGLAARAAGADRRARNVVAMASADLAVGEVDRPDEHTRLALGRHCRAAVSAAEAAIRRHALRLLADQMTAARAEGLLQPTEAVSAQLAASGLLRDTDLIGEWLARVRQDMLVAALPVAVNGPDEPSLLARLSLAPDAPVARAAAALLAADSRRRDQFERGEPDGAELPPALHARLVWWVAAAMRGGAHDGARDHALAEAAARCLAAQEDGDRADMLAMRLAAAIDPRPAEIASLLVEAIGDRRLGFFIALIAHMLDLPFDQARTIVLEPEGDRLWLALRALKLDRPSIARIGLALGEADPARDIEVFADALDAIVAVPAAEAHAALMPLTLDPRFLAAIRMVEEGGR